MQPNKTKQHIQSCNQNHNSSEISLDTSLPMGKGQETYANPYDLLESYQDCREEADLSKAILPYSHNLSSFTQNFVDQGINEGYDSSINSLPTKSRADLIE